MNKRALSSTIMLLAVILLSVSGLPLHFAILRADRGTSHFLMSVHNSAAILFLAAAAYHLVANRQTILRQTINRTRHLLLFRREAVVGATIVLGFTLLVASHALHAQS